jgi:hypothetical protein
MRKALARSVTLTNQIIAAHKVQQRMLTEFPVKGARLKSRPRVMGRFI